MNYGRVYLSGSMSHDDYESDFSAVAGALLLQGIDVYNPADVQWGRTKNSGRPAEGMRENAEALASADTIFLMGNWTQARGCIAEVMMGAIFGCVMLELDEKELLSSGSISLRHVGIDRSNLNDEIASLLLNQRAG